MSKKSSGWKVEQNSERAKNLPKLIEAKNNCHPNVLKQKNLMFCINLNYRRRVFFTKIPSFLACDAFKNFQ